jgi:transposase
LILRTRLRLGPDNLRSGALVAATQAAVTSAAPTEHLRVRQDLQRVDNASQMMEEVEAELGRLSVSAPWSEQVAYLIRLPGIGVVSAMTLMAAIGDITRFPSAKHLVGYSGLGARVHASGQTHRGGGISKHGRRELRRVMVETAWSAVLYSSYWKEEFQRLRARLGDGKAIVAIARKLLVVVWHVLTHRAADRQANRDAVARSFKRWASRQGAATAIGLPRPQFVRRELARLGLDSHQPAIRHGDRVRASPTTTSLSPVPF